LSTEEYDRRAAAKTSLNARINSIEGALRGAQLNLEFTRITAPITGRVGRAEITEGNLVDSGGAQVRPLTTLVSLDPIYAYFDVDEQTYLKYARAARSRAPSSRDLRNTAQLGLAGEAGFPHIGEMSFVDNQVNSTTGTIRLRATFGNKTLALTPGLFARIRLQGGGAYSGCLVRDEAVLTDLNQEYVLVLGKNNTLEYRPVIIGPITEGLRVVRGALHKGDVIVVSGLQRARPGATVTPRRVSLTDQPDAPAKPSAQSAFARGDGKAHEPEAGK
jgi:membrane fusion protein, multidrug efflux system